MAFKVCDKLMIHILTKYLPDTFLIRVLVVFSVNPLNLASIIIIIIYFQFCIKHTADMINLSVTWSLISGISSYIFHYLLSLSIFLWVSLLFIMFSTLFCFNSLFFLFYCSFLFIEKFLLYYKTTLGRCVGFDIKMDIMVKKN